MKMTSLLWIALLTLATFACDDDDNNASSVDLEMNFTGSFGLQGTLTVEPTEDDWFDINLNANMNVGFAGMGRYMPSFWIKMCLQIVYMCTNTWTSVTNVGVKNRERHPNAVWQVTPVLLSDIEEPFVHSFYPTQGSKTKQQSKIIEACIVC